MDAAWQIVEPRFSVADARAWEGLFTLGSGYLHVRGSLEEHLADAPQNLDYTRRPANVTAEKFPEMKLRWGTFVPGVWGDHPFMAREMANLPWFLGLTPVVAGERLDLEQSQITDYRRSLNMHAAILQRSLRWQTRNGAAIDVTFERFVSAARPALTVQRLTLTPDREVSVTVIAGIDSDVRTSGYDHFTRVVLVPDHADGARCEVVTDAGYAVTILSRVSASTPAIWVYRADGERVVQRSAAILIPAGATVTIEKRTAVATSIDRQPVAPEDLLDAVAALGYDALRDEHAAIWAARWAACDVSIEGDVESQRAIRVSIFHLLRALVPDDSRVAIDAKGYAGDAYRGQFFWDVDMYMLPFFLYTAPDRARGLVDFRIGTLPGALANAAHYGYPGARYPWETNDTGRETCVNWQYADHEVHVTADVVYGLAHYARATGDPAFWASGAARVVVETARYWLARLDWQPGADHPDLLGVMGPDEYAAITSNNAYTNRMVRFALALAAEIGAVGGASEDERARFADAAARLPIPRAADGVLVLQCDEWQHFAEPDFAHTWPDRSRPFAAQVSQERLYRTKCPKQADVLLLMILFPDEFTAAEQRRAWDHYVPYTTHDSSLSTGIHAIMAAQLGLKEDAWHYWQHSAAIDADPARGGAAEGIHIAAAGANWLAVICGFAGLRTALQAEALTLRPRLPAAWTRLAFPLIWQGCPVTINITHTSVTVANRGTAPLAVQIAGQPGTIAPGNTGEFPLKREVYELNGITRGRKSSRWMAGGNSRWMAGVE